MATFVQNNESIEGEKVAGSSRKPIEYKGVIWENGRKLHKFVSRFNSKATITQEMPKSTLKIVKASKTDLGDEVICDDTLIRSIDKKYSQSLESNASGTHGASVWSYPNHTNIMVTRSHQEIENAIRRRAIEQDQKKNLSN